MSSGGGMNSEVELVRAVNRVAIPVDAPDRVLILPWGENVRLDGKTFVVDAEAAAACVNFFERWGVDLSFDYEHHSEGGEYAAPDGKAIAAGWANKLEVEEDVGVWAVMEWTEAAANHIRLKEYRYLSPVIHVRKSDRRVALVKSVTLTNTPMITGFPAMVNKGIVMEEKFERTRWWLNLPETSTQEQIMDELSKYLTQLREMAGADEDAAGGAVVAALKAKIDAAKAAGELQTHVCKALELKADATAEQICEAITNKASTAAGDAGATDKDKRIELLESNLKKTTEQLSAMSETFKGRDVETRINAAKAAGKISDADLEKHGEYLRKLARDEKEWSAYTDLLPCKVPADGRVVTGNKGSGGGTSKTTVIKNSAAEWDAEPELQKLCDKKDYVADQLRVNKLDPKFDEKELELVA